MRISPRRMRRLELLEAELGSASPEHRLAIALHAADEAFWAAGISPLERDTAARRVVSRLPLGWQRRPELAEEITDSLAEELATDGRQAAIRAIRELASQIRDWPSSWIGRLRGRYRRRIRLPTSYGRRPSPARSGASRWHVYAMCMSFGRRFQILLDEARYERLAAAARERHVSVAAVIRAAIDVALPSGEGKKRAAVKVILEADPMPVPARVEELKSELDELHSKGF